MVLGEKHGLPAEHDEAAEWPTSSPPSSENLKLARRLCSNLIPSSAISKTNTLNRTGWSAQDCIKLEYPEQSYIVKVPRHQNSGTVAACDAERIRACWAAENGFGPGVVTARHESGAFAMRFIKGQTLADPELARQHMPQIMGLLRRFHSSPAPTEMVYWDPLVRVQKTLDIAKQSPFMAEKDIQLIGNLISRVRDEIGNVSQLHVPCHNDFHGLNMLLDKEGRLWAVDYEECNLGDPMWDLAYLTATLELERYELAESYGCTAEQRMRLGYYYFLAIGYCGTWRATHGRVWERLHHDCMARLRETLKKNEIDLGP